MLAQEDRKTDGGNRMTQFEPPVQMDVTDSHGGFTALTWGTRQGFSTLWRPARVALGGTAGTRVQLSVNRYDAYQDEQPVISARYRLPRYPCEVKVWWRLNGERIA
jgi:hypothetical protein